jgi:hypothetical protein
LWPISSASRPLVPRVRAISSGTRRGSLRLASGTQETPALKSGHELRGDFEGQPCLARAASARQRQQTSVAAEDPDDIAQLPVPADEGRRGTREVRVRDRLQRRKPLAPELEDRHRRGEVLEAVQTQIRRVLSDEAARGLGQEHLAAVANGRDAGTEMHVLAHVALRRHDRRPRVEPHADPHRPGRERTLARLRGTDRSLGVAEGVEERIALRIHFDAGGGREGSTQQTAVLGQSLGVLLGPELVQERGRALDVGEEEGDAVAGKVAAHSRMMR